MLEPVTAVEVIEQVSAVEMFEWNALVADLKFHQNMAAAAQKLQTKHRELIFARYNIKDGDQIDLNGKIVRKPIETPKPAPSENVVPMNPEPKKE